MKDVERCTYMLPSFRVKGKTLVEAQVCDRPLSDPCGFCKEFDKNQESLAQSYRELIDSCVMGNIVRFVFREFESPDIATWENEGGR